MTDSKKILNPESGRFIAYGGKLHRSLIKKGKMPNEILGAYSSQSKRHKVNSEARGRDSHTKGRSSHSQRPSRYTKSTYDGLNETEKKEVDAMIEEMRKQRLSRHKPREQDYSRSDSESDSASYSD